MAHSCRIVSDEYRGEGRWHRSGDELVLSPVSAAPFSVAIGEVSGIASDGFNISLKIAARMVRLEKLGGDGPTLTGDLWRDWPVLRAKLLRLTDGDKPAKMFTGTMQSPGTGPFHGFIVDDRLLFAREGEDVDCLFLSDCQSVLFDPTSYAVTVTLWGGQIWSFARLGGESEAFTAALRSARDGLAAAAQQTIARYLPTVSGAGRTKLAWQWLPGRILSIATLEGMAPGFAEAFAASWLHSTPREESGLALMKGAAPSDMYLGYRPADSGDTVWLWLLVRRGDEWSLEQLAQEDYATYLFKGGVELPALVAGLVRLPEFSREALYLPLEELVADRADYAIAARDLPLLRDLRAHFAGRRVHAAGNAAT